MAPPPPPQQPSSDHDAQDGSGSGGDWGDWGNRPPRTRLNGVLLGVVYLFLFLLVAAASGIGYLAFDPPSDLIRQKIAEQVKARTGRDLRLAGPASFVFFPKLGVSLKDVSLSGLPGAAAKLVAMDSLDVSVSVMSLLSRKVEISTLVLRKPVFDFRIDKKGRKNWDFAAAVSPRFAELRTEGSARDYVPIVIAGADAGTFAKNLGHIDDLHFEDVRVENGTFSLTDERSGRTDQVTSVNAKIALDSLASPLTAGGNLAWRGETLNFDGKIPDIRPIMRKAPAELSLAVQSPKLQASYDGGLQIKDSLTLDGRVAAQSSSTRDLARWFGIDLPPVSGFGPLSIQGDLKAAGNNTTFSNARFGLDGAMAKGTIAVTTGGVRPLVDAKLAISELDLNKYLTNAVTGPIAKDGAPPQTDSIDERSDGAKSNKPDAIEKLLNQPGTKVYGAIQRDGWSSEQLNLTLLTIADGNADLDVGKLLFKNLTIGQSSVTIALKDRAMRANFKDIALYQGRGKGLLALNGSSGTPQLSANFALDGLSAQPFLHDAMNFDRIAGKAQLGFQLSALGASQLQLVESLSGTARFAFTDGAIVGFNVPGAIRSLSRGSLAGLQATPSAKTDFASMQGTFGLTNGVAENSDLQIFSPLLRVTGEGTFHLPERTIDYTIKPRLVASLEGQETSDGEASGFEVPVRISGSWDNPRYKPDLKGLLGDPNKTLDAIKSIGKQFKGKNAGEIVNDLLGKGNGESNTDPNSGAGDILKKLFKSPKENN